MIGVFLIVLTFLSTLKNQDDSLNAPKHGLKLMGKNSYNFTLWAFPYLDTTLLSWLNFLDSSDVEVLTAVKTYIPL